MPNPNATLDEISKRYLQRNDLNDRDRTIIKEAMRFPHNRRRIGALIVRELDSSVNSNLFCGFIQSRWNDRQNAVLAITSFMNSDEMENALGRALKYSIPFDKRYEKKIEPYIDLLKYLQQGSHTRTEIAKHFGASETTIQKYLSDLEQGVHMMGKTIKVNSFTWNSNHYDPSIHPIFLTLNLTEVNALTVELKRLFGDGGELENHPFRKQFLDIADDVHSQLSNYAALNIDANANLANIRFNEPLKTESYRNEEAQLAYHMKSSARCEVHCHKRGVLTGFFTYQNAKPNHATFITDGDELIHLPYSEISAVYELE